MFKFLKIKLLGFLYAIFFSFFNIFGFIYQYKTKIEEKGYLILIFGTIFLSFIVYHLYYYIKKSIFELKDKLFFENQIKEKKSIILYFFVVYILHLLIYLIILLAYYPGLFTYDVNFQVIQHIGTYNTHHPILHTLLLNSMMKIGYYILGDATDGIAILSFIQIFFSITSFSIMHLFFYINNLNKKLRYIFVFFTIFTPFIQVLHLSMIKDSIFSSFFVLFILITYIISKKNEYFYDRSKYTYIYFFIIIIMLSFRHNSMYTMFVFIISMLIYILLLYKKEILELIKSKRIFHNKYFNIVVVSLIAFVFSFLFNLKINTFLCSKVDNQREAYSVPCQQLGLVFNTKDLTVSEQDEIINCISYITSYNSVRADFLKEIGSIHLGPKFIKTYFKYLIKYPITYIKAYLLLNQGYFYLFDKTCSDIYGKGRLGELGGAGLFLTDHHSGYGVSKRVKLYSVNKLYEDLFSENKYQNYFPLHIWCSMGFYIWLLILMFFYSIEDKVFNFTIYSFIIIYILMLTLGPCAIIRYGLPFISVVPIYIFDYLSSIYKKIC